MESEKLMPKLETDKKFHSLYKTLKPCKCGSYSVRAVKWSGFLYRKYKITCNQCAWSCISHSIRKLIKIWNRRNADDHK